MDGSQLSRGINGNEGKSGEDLRSPDGSEEASDSSASSSAWSSGSGDVNDKKKSSNPFSFPLTKGSSGGTGDTGEEVVTNEVLHVEELIVTYFDEIRKQMTNIFPNVIYQHLFVRTVDAKDGKDGKFREAIVSLHKTKEEWAVTVSL